MIKDAKNKCVLQEVRILRLRIRGKCLRGLDMCQGVITGRILFEGTASNY